MEKKSCYLCKSNNIETIHNGTRDNPDINVLKCKDCGLVFLSSFSHIADEVYEESGMHNEKEEIEIEKYRKETEKDDRRRVKMLDEVIKNKRVLDFGCGNGGFLKYSKELTSSIAGVELEKKEREFLINEGFTILKDIEETNEKFDVITLFHVLEHLKNPIVYLKKFEEKLNDDGEIIIEIPNANDALLSIYNSDAFADFTYWSFHLFLYNVDTIAKLANLAGLKVKWIKQIQRYSFANHLYWLAQKKPGGHIKWSFMDDDELEYLYSEKLRQQNACDTLMISLIK